LFPSLGKAVAYFILAALFSLAAWNFEKFPAFVRYSLIACGIVFGSAGLVELVNYIAYSIADRKSEFASAAMILAQAQAMSPAVEAMRLMVHLSDNAQLEMAVHWPTLGFTVSNLWGNSGEGLQLYPYLDDPNGRIPISFAQEFLQKSDHRYLCAIRAFAEGSHNRRWAESFTRRMLAAGLAEPAAGNQPARWRTTPGGTSFYFRVADLFQVTEDVN
jgi:hypothetical protein